MRCLWPVRVLATFALIVPLIAYGEDISYVIAAAAAKLNEAPIASGLKHYTLHDVRVKESRGPDGASFWTKGIELEKGFSVNVQVTRETTITGFGITISNPRYLVGFSWNWFDLDADGIYKQLKGGSRVRVQLQHNGAIEEVTGIEFLDDTLLTFTDNMFLRKAGEDTHAVTIRKGSVLRVAP